MENQYITGIQMILNEIKHQSQLIFLMKSSIKHQGVCTSKLQSQMTVTNKQIEHQASRRFTNHQGVSPSKLQSQTTFTNNQIKQIKRQGVCTSKLQSQTSKLRSQGQLIFLMKSSIKHLCMQGRRNKINKTVTLFHLQSQTTVPWRRRNTYLV